MTSTSGRSTRQGLGLMRLRDQGPATEPDRDPRAVVHAAAVTAPGSAPAECSTIAASCRVSNAAATVSTPTARIPRS